MARSLGEVDVAERDRSPRYARAQAGVAQEGHRDRGLAAAGLAHETEHLAAMQIEGDAVDYVVVALDHLNAQVADAEDELALRHHAPEPSGRGPARSRRRKVDADSEHGDGDRRRKHGQRRDVQANAVFTNHDAPVGGRWLVEVRGS